MFLFARIQVETVTLICFQICKNIDKFNVDFTGRTDILQSHDVAMDCT